MAKPAILFRADGHAQMGLGHLIRSAALAEMLASRFEVHFAFRHCPKGVQEKFSELFVRLVHLRKDEGVAEARELVAYAQETSPGTIVVLDGYHFRTDYQEVIVEAGLPLVCIDDIHAYHFLAHVIINHAGGISQELYSAEDYTKFCLGPQFALLRKPFRHTAEIASAVVHTETGFICLGGADPPNATLQVLQKCVGTFPQYTFDVVLGESYPHRAALDTFLATVDTAVNVYVGLPADAMAKLMRASDFGVTSPSTVSFEYLSVGRTLYLVPIADNQAAIYKYYLSSGLAYSFAEFPVRDEVALRENRERRRELFDTQTQQRFLKVFQSMVDR